MAPPCEKPSHLFCHVLSIDPLIIIGLGNLGPFSPALQLCEPLRDQRAYFILGSSWDLDDLPEFSKTVQRYQEFRVACPKHEFIYMTNTENHARNLRAFGVPAFFCHHNALIDERIYRIHDIRKSYDAIYNARLDPFKRHFLAKLIPSLALIYYNMSGEDGYKYRDDIFKLLPQAIPLNDASGQYKFLNHYDICRFINRAHVGLVLSAVEGGMHASVEYLLSGVPVVSTTNSGGRNHFLLPEVSRIVEPDPRKVRDAVEELKSLEIPAETIRRITLKRCAPHRITLQGMVQDIFDHEGANRKFSDEWDTVYVNKMCNWGITDWQVVDYIRTWRGMTDKVVEPLRRDFAWEREMKQLPRRAARAAHPKKLQGRAPVRPFCSAAPKGSPRANHSAGAPSNRPCGLGVWPGLQGRVPQFPGPDSDRFFHGDDEYLAVADGAGLGAGGDGVHHPGGQGVRHHRLDLDLGVEEHRVLRAAVDVGVSLLPAVALHLGHGHSLDPNLVQGGLHRLKHVRLDDCFYLLHGHFSGLAV